MLDDSLPPAVSCSVGIILVHFNAVLFNLFHLMSILLLFATARSQLPFEMFQLLCFILAPYQAPKLYASLPRSHNSSFQHLFYSCKILLHIAMWVLLMPCLCSLSSHTKKGSVVFVYFEQEERMLAITYINLYYNCFLTSGNKVLVSLMLINRKWSTDLFVQDSNEVILSDFWVFVHKPERQFVFFLHRVSGFSFFSTHSVIWKISS